VKALFFLLLFLAALWLWRALTAKSGASGQRPATDQEQPVNMVCCHQCGVHLPASDAVKGHNGFYCTAAHLQQAEG